MGKVNVCLKYVFVFFNGLFNAFGWLMIFGAVRATSTGLSQIGNPIWVWLLIISILCISGLGVYGGRTENALALKIFAGCMGVGMVIMMIFGFLGVGERNQVQDAINNGSLDLTNAEAQLLDEMFQIALGICFGLVVAAAMSLGMSIMMIRQIQRYDSREPATFSM